jgi:transposase
MKSYSTERRSSVARPTKLTPEVVKKIVLAINAGNYAKVAAQMAGIGETTYYRWLEMSEKPSARKEYREFRESIERAEAEAEVIALTRVRQAADNGDWKAAGWFLERKHGERWGRNDKIRQEISGVDGAPIMLSLDEAKKAVLAFLEEGETEYEFINSGEDSSTT